MTPYTILNNSYIVNNAIKGAEGPPDLTDDTFLSLEPALGVRSEKSFLLEEPQTIGHLCCEFQVPRTVTVGGDAFQRPKSASKIVRV